MAKPVGPSRPDERTRKVSWDMVRRSGAPRADERPLRVPTGCQTRDDFIRDFAAVASADGLTVPAGGSWAVGARVALSATLADGSVVLEGRGEVVEVKAAAPGARDTRPLVRVKLLELDEDNQQVFLALGDARREAAPPADFERTVVPAGESGPSRARAPSRPPPMPGSARVTTKTLPPSPLPRTVSSPPVEARTSGPTQPRYSPAPATARVRPTPSAAPPAPETDAVAPPAALASPVASPVASPPAGLDGAAEGRTQSPRPASTSVGHDDAPFLTPMPEWISPSGGAHDDTTGRTALPVRSMSEVRAAAHAVRRRLPPGLRKTLWQAVPFAFCTILGWGVGYKMGALRERASMSQREPAENLRDHGGEPAAPAEAEIAVVEAPPEAPAVPVSQRAPAPPASRPGGCVAHVDSRPTDVTVVWSGRTIGKTPLRGAPVPCGAATVTFERDRYASVNRQVVATAGTDVVLDERLTRPPANLRIASTPQGAAVVINGRQVGKTPVAVPVMRFESARLEVRLSGFRPWRNSVYVKDSHEQVEATLEPASGKRR